MRPAAAAREREGWGSRAGVFAVAVYVGYFGAAGGVLMLALLLRLFRESLARTNALKNVISGLANAVAGIGFAIFGPVRWSAALPLAAGFLLGGWIGPKIVRRCPRPARVHRPVRPGPRVHLGRLRIGPAGAGRRPPGHLRQ